MTCEQKKVEIHNCFLGGCRFCSKKRYYLLRSSITDALNFEKGNYSITVWQPKQR